MKNVGCVVLITGMLVCCAALNAQTPATFTVTPVGTSTIQVDPAHSVGNRFEFVVTNNSTALDYITIQRADTRSGNQQVLGVPSPEYGISLPPGASGNMFFRWDLFGEGTTPGTYTATVPFKSELTGAIVSAPMTYIITNPANPSGVTIRGKVAGADGTPLGNATISAINLDSSSGIVTITFSDPGGNFWIQATSGKYALVADAAGYTSSTLFIDPSTTPNAQFTLNPSRLSVDPSRVVSRQVNLTSSVWEMRASQDLSVIATAPMSSNSPSAFQGVRNGQLAWTSSFPGVDPAKSAAVSQFQAIDCDVAVSANGAYVAGMDYGGKVYLIDAATGVTRWSTDRAQDKNPSFPSTSKLGVGFYTCGAVAFSPDGTALAAGGSNGWLVMFDVSTGNVRWSTGYSAEIRALRFTPDGSRLAVGAGDWKFRMVNTQTGATLWSATNHFWPLFFVAMDSAATEVGAGGKDGQFQVWDTSTGQLKWDKTYTGGAFVSGGAISDDLSRVVVSNWSFGVHGYDGAGNPVWLRPMSNTDIAVTPDGKFILAGGYRGNQRTATIALLDQAGTILWHMEPNLAQACTVQAPFQGDFFKQLAITTTGSGSTLTVKGAAACIGGTIFTFDIPITGASDDRVSALSSGDGFSIHDISGASLISGSGNAGTSVGYGRIQTTSGSVAGLAIFGYRQAGVLVSEAGVPAAAAVQSGRIFVELSSPTINTGLAIANPNAQDAVITFYFTDSNGINSAQGQLAVPANGQIARFLDQDPFLVGTSFTGTFTFSSNISVGVIALRGILNERSEFLITTLPVAPVVSTNTGAAVFPHYADGGGWMTDIVLVNPTDSTITGSIQFNTKDGTPDMTLTYSIPARTSKQYQTAGTATVTHTGWVKVTPAANSTTPEGVAIFSFRSSGITVSVAGVPISPAAASFRLYVEGQGTFGERGSMQSGVAIANPGSTAVAVNIQLFNLDGTSTGLTTTQTVPANGQIGVFVNQLFPALGGSFTGTLSVSPPSNTPVSIVGLRARYNERGDFLITTTPSINTTAASPTDLVFPHIASDGGYTTQFIVFNPSGQSTSATVRFYNQTGSSLPMTLQ